MPGTKSLDFFELPPPELIATAPPATGELFLRWMKELWDRFPFPDFPPGENMEDFLIYCHQVRFLTPPQLSPFCQAPTKPDNWTQAVLFGLQLSRWFQQNRHPYGFGSMTAANIVGDLLLHPCRGVTDNQFAAILREAKGIVSHSMIPLCALRMSEGLDIARRTLDLVRSFAKSVIRASEPDPTRSYFRLLLWLNRKERMSSPNCVTVSIREAYFALPVERWKIWEPLLLHTATYHGSLHMDRRQFTSLFEAARPWMDEARRLIESSPDIGPELLAWLTLHNQLGSDPPSLSSEGAHLLDSLAVFAILAESVPAKAAACQLLAAPWAKEPYSLTYGLWRKLPWLNPSDPEVLVKDYCNRWAPTWTLRDFEETFPAVALNSDQRRRLRSCLPCKRLAKSSATKGTGRHRDCKSSPEDSSQACAPTRPTRKSNQPESSPRR